MSMTIDGKVVSSHTHSYKVTGKFRETPFEVRGRLMAHPDWKFGDVVQHRSDLGTKVLLTSRNPDGDWIGQGLDAGLSTLGRYSIPHTIIDDWHLVPEYEEAVLAESPVAYWPLSEGSITIRDYALSKEEVRGIYVADTEPDD